MELRYRQLRAGLLAVRERLDELRIEAESADGLIVATVDGRGRLVDVTLDPRIRRHADAGALARDVLATVRRAAELAATAAAEFTAGALRAGDVR
ncbi:YbaB/EbfC family nucleoid-associated protein [Plantactinospora sonchi]|uniref:YbaB/EbfC family nucleoid-associated protein n=1 Tax=Plantactinospora sonchi TaxID=1544735 RepID=A0ABU7RP19_9ACTN